LSVDYITKYAILFLWFPLNYYITVKFPFSSAIKYVEQELLSGNTAVIAETGDSWFNCQKLRLPENCG
jgi:hypothetical protein